MKYLLLSVSLYSLTFIKAQDIGWKGKESNPLADITLNLTVPQGDFAHNTSSMGFGIYGGYYLPFSPSAPVYLGIDGGWTLKGSHSEHLRQSVEIKAGNTVLDVLPINLDIETRNTITNLFASLRLVIPFANIRPYVEPKIGFNYLVTNTKIYDRTPNYWFSRSDDNLISSDNQLSSFVLAYGGEAGFLAPINENVAIKLGLSYIFGGEAEYYDETQINNWDITYGGSNYNSNNIQAGDLQIMDNSTPHRSTTNVYRIHVGLSYNLY